MDNRGGLPPSYFEAVRMPRAAPPPSPGGVYPQAKGVPVVVVTTVVPLGSRPIQMLCPHCCTESRTVTEKQPGLFALFSGMALAMFGCVWGCCLVPCFLDDCLDTEHCCQNCHAHVGNYKR